MAVNAEYISELVRAHYAGDDRRFSTLLSQIIAAESRAGHGRLAERLRELRIEGSRAVDGETPAGQVARATPLARAPQNLQQLLSISYSDVRLDDLVMAPSLRQALGRFVVEQRASTRLAEHNLQPRRRLLLHGPPGCGKTMSARALAGELRLPLVRVRLEVLYSRYLGETAGALSDIFAEMTRTRGVYLFDEFDALGRTRLDDAEVGEVKRVVSTFLQLMDADGGDSIIIAATNIGITLDPAVFRRFDDVLEIPFPTDEQREKLLLRLLRVWRLRPTQDMIAMSSDLSFADIHAAVEDAYKDAVLEHRDKPTKIDVLERLRARQARLRS